MCNNKPIQEMEANKKSLEQAARDRFVLSPDLVFFRQHFDANVMLTVPPSDHNRTGGTWNRHPNKYSSAFPRQ